MLTLLVPHHQVFVEGVVTKNNSNFAAAMTIILNISEHYLLSLRGARQRSSANIYQTDEILMFYRET